MAPPLRDPKKSQTPKVYILSSLYPKPQNEDSVREHVASGAGVDGTMPGANTALMEAARNGHQEVVGLLLEGGADRRVEDSQGRTAHGKTDAYIYTLEAS